MLFGGSGGVANLKTVPIYQGVTDVFLRSSYSTDSDETLATWGLHIELGMGFIGEEKTPVSLISILLGFLGYSIGYSLTASITNVYLSSQQGHLCVCCE